MPFTKIVNEPSHPISREDAHYWTLAPAAVGEIISGLEALTRTAAYGPNGLLQGLSSKRERSVVPQALRKAIDSRGGAVAIKAMGVVGGALTLTGRRSRAQQIAGAGLMLASSGLSKYRTSFGRDGADHMAALICGYRVLTALVPEAEKSDDLFLRAVNAQTFIAYVTAGAAKAISSTWRSGEALEQVLQTQQYGDSTVAKWLKKSPLLCSSMTWFTIVWETGFPVVYLLAPANARRALAGVKLFHLGIAVTMGLPRFFWGFSSAHAAVLYAVDRLPRNGGRG
ncbi:hypothetical protein ACFVTF_31945 [Kitasatospora sp. NPDC057940]|uniref:hypothetical protein n=1 Tax=Kitasatospora sp. NPDC057940 TaxID=3346285 RepID=UPI0036DE9B8A